MSSGGVLLLQRDWQLVIAWEEFDGTHCIFFSSQMA